MLQLRSVNMSSKIAGQRPFFPDKVAQRPFFKTIRKILYIFRRGSILSLAPTRASQVGR